MSRYVDGNKSRKASLRSSIMFLEKKHWKLFSRSPRSGITFLLSAPSKFLKEFYPIKISCSAKFLPPVFLRSSRFSVMLLRKPRGCEYSNLCTLSFQKWKAQPAKAPTINTSRNTSARHQHALMSKELKKNSGTISHRIHAVSADIGTYPARKNPEYACFVRIVVCF